MTSEYRFFFVYFGSILFTLIFLVGITFVPLICGIRYLIAKIRSPGDPPELKDPSRPEKPKEPKIGASSEEWIEYRKRLTQYRVDKAKWKEEMERKRETESKSRKDYDENKLKRERETRRYRTKVLLPARKGLCYTFELTTSQVLFIKDETPILIRSLLKSYYTIGSNLTANYV